MNKRSIDLLEKVYAAEIDGALNNHFGIFQTKSKLAKHLEQEGYLQLVSCDVPGWPPIKVEGYRLTLLGNFTYCMDSRCSGEPE